MSFSDLEVEPPRLRHFNDRAASTAGGGGGGLGSAARRAPGAVPNDGSAHAGGGRAGGGARGLGFGAAAAGGGEEGGDAGEGDDVFSSYRRLRSDGYHQFIAKSAAGKFEKEARGGG